MSGEAGNQERSVSSTPSNRSPEGTKLFWSRKDTARSIIVTDFIFQVLSHLGKENEPYFKSIKDIAVLFSGNNHETLSLIESFFSETDIGLSQKLSIETVDVEPPSKDAVVKKFPNGLPDSVELKAVSSDAIEYLQSKSDVSLDLICAFGSDFYFESSSDPSLSRAQYLVTVEQARKNREDFISEVGRVLRPGGMLFVTAYGFGYQEDLNAFSKFGIVPVGESSYIQNKDGSIWGQIFYKNVNI